MSKYGFNTKAIHAGNTSFQPDSMSDPIYQSVAYPYQGTCKSIVTHPASTTHSAMGEAQMQKAGISPSMIRFSIGIEDETDLINDPSKALDALDDKVKVKEDPAAKTYPQAY